MTTFISLSTELYKSMLYYTIQGIKMERDKECVGNALHGVI